MDNDTASGVFLQMVDGTGAIIQLQQAYCEMGGRCFITLKRVVKFVAGMYTFKLQTYTPADGIWHYTSLSKPDGHDYWNVIQADDKGVPLPPNPPPPAKIIIVYPNTGTAGAAVTFDIYGEGPWFLPNNPDDGSYSQVLLETETETFVVPATFMSESQLHVDNYVLPSIPGAATIVEQHMPWGTRSNAYPFTMA
jgi:hypothetical protein